MAGSKRIKRLVAYTRARAEREKVKDRAAAEAIRIAYKEDPTQPISREALKVIRKNRLRAAAEALDGAPDKRPQRISPDDHQPGVFRG